MESLQTVSVLEQALERTNGNRVLAELLVKVTRNFVTPLDDPLYDWRIKRLSEINEQVRTTTADGLTWRRVPDTVECRTFKAPANQCALAWGHRLVPGNSVPTPLAVLIWATRAEDGSVTPVMGTQFYYRQSDQSTTSRWFTTDQSIDPRLADAILHYLNNCTGGSSTSPSAMQGVDLDQDE